MIYGIECRKWNLSGCLEIDIFSRKANKQADKKYAIVILCALHSSTCVLYRQSLCQKEKAYFRAAICDPLSKGNFMPWAMTHGLSLVDSYSDGHTNHLFYGSISIVIVSHPKPVQFNILFLQRSDVSHEGVEDPVHIDKHLSHTRGSIMLFLHLVTWRSYT